jgi:hypothetical protein
VFGLGDDEISAPAQDRSRLTFGQLPVRVVIRSELDPSLCLGDFCG